MWSLVEKYTFYLVSKNMDHGRGRFVDCSVGWGKSLAEQVPGVVGVGVQVVARSSGCDNSKLGTYSQLDFSLTLTLTLTFTLSSLTLTFFFISARLVSRNYPTHNRFCLVLTVDRANWLGVSLGYLSMNYSFDTRCISPYILVFGVIRFSRCSNANLV